jgi:stage III sporulation protein AD
MLKGQKNEYAVIIALVCSVIVIRLIAKQILSPLSVIMEKIESYGINNNYFKIALKALGIGYVTAFISDSCKDAGLSSLALKAELAGKCAIFILSFPLILSILETAVGFVK